MKDKISWTTCIKQFLRYASPYGYKLILAILALIFSNGIYAMNPSIEGSITTQLMKDVEEISKGVEGAHIHFDIVLKIIGILIICYLTRAAMILVSNFLLTNAIQSMMHDLRNALQRKIQRLPVRYFDNRAFGDVLSTVTNDVDTLSNGLQQTFTKAITGFLTFLLAFVMMFRINWKMGALALIILPLTALITKIFVGRSQKLFQLQQTNVGELNGKITELYGGFNEIILYNKQEDVKEQFKEVNERMAQSAFKAQFVSSLISPFVSLVTYLTIGAASVVGCIFVMQGSITVGSLQAFIRYIWQINEPLSQVSQLSAQVQASFAAMGRIFTLLEEEEEAQEGTASIVPEEMKGNVSFDHVQFGYGEDLLMKDVNFHVKSGQMVAIVGPTGAGKTTLMNLLLRFYDVKGGSIKIDGVDIRDMDRGKLHSLFSLVLQDTWLFHGSIYENIRWSCRIHGFFMEQSMTTFAMDV